MAVGDGMMIEIQIIGEKMIITLGEIEIIEVEEGEISSEEEVETKVEIEVIVVVFTTVDAIGTNYDLKQILLIQKFNNKKKIK